MAKKEPVNINWQTIFAIIPWANLYAAYRVEKFRLFFLLMIGVSVSIAVLTYFIEFEPSQYLGSMVGIPLYVAFIRSWSKKWNEQFVNSQLKDDHSHNPV